MIIHCEFYNNTNLPKYFELDIHPNDNEENIRI